ncbi:MAG: FmdB family zinc ribbon protein [Armatimonadota bacterium]
MPIYEFQCHDCQAIFEELVRMGSNGEGLSCPSCGSASLSKMMSAFYGRSSGGNGSYNQVAGSGCGCGGNCGGDCGSCGGGCSCHH